MKILIAEDDAISRRFLSKLLSKYGQCDLVIDGLEAIDAYLLSMKENKPYNLICLDIMMPKIDGVKVLKAIRDLELKKRIKENKRTKVIMTTALGEAEYVKTAYAYGCEAYIPKPIDTEKLIEKLNDLGLVEN